MFTEEIPYSALPITSDELILKSLAWSQKYQLIAYYTHNNIEYPHNGFKQLLAVSNNAPLELDKDKAFKGLRDNLKQNHSLLCGYLTYDLKNQVERLNSSNPDHLEFPPLFLFEPEIYIYFNPDSLTIYSTGSHIDNIIAEILSTTKPVSGLDHQINVLQRVTPADYIVNVNKIKDHILEGNVYELNYCIEFYAEKVELNPLSLYIALNQASPTPFSGFLKYHDKFLLCASPERYLKKEGTKLISQPIKGTVRRGATPEEDIMLQKQLRSDEKELAENMMIVDLVRNDLSRTCEIGTVQVEEMFGIYGFRQVSQMISTITGILKPEKDLIDAIKGSFPMGSMTGAPKISAMQIIEDLEVTKRGLYSGTFGYIDSNQDCDFNVVIRSIQYNSTNKYLSFMVGSAITYDSVPEREYEECLLKAQAIMKVLNSNK